MLRNYLTTALRSLVKQPIHVTINVLGLAIGLAAALLVILYVRFETSYDDFQPNVESTFRMGAVWTDVRADPVASYVSLQAQQIAQAQPAVEDLFALFPSSPREKSSGEQVRIGERYLRLLGHHAATPNLEEFVALETLAGDLKVALNAPDQLAVSRKEALRLFGSVDVVGRTLIRARGAWTVAAVFEDLPANTHFDFASLSSVRDIAANAAGYTYLRLRENIDTAVLSTRLSEQVSRRVGGKMQVTLHPLSGLHLETAGVRDRVEICIALSLVLIAIAAFNFINLSTSQAGQRAREIGVRKTVGASRVRIACQFLVESLVLATVAAILAGIFSKLGLPAFNQLVNRELSAALQGEAGVLLLVISMLLGLIAGLYPALFLSSFSVRRAVSGELHRGDTGIRVRKSLFLVQAALCAGSIAAALALYQQVRFLDRIPTGYERVGRLEIRGIESRKLFEHPDDSLIREFEDIPGVQSAALFDRSLTDGPGWVTDIVLREPDQRVISGFTAAGFDFIDAVGLQLIAGRDFSAAAPADWHHMDTQGVERASIILTQSMARSAGYEPAEAIGKEFRLSGRVRGTVVGVVDDITIGSVKQEQRPIFFICGLSYSPTASVILHLASDNVAGVQGDVARVIGARLGIDAPDMRFIAEQYRAIYRYEDGQTRLVAVFSVLAIALSCVGTFGLAALSMQRRQREFAIRRVHGASRATLFALLTGEYVRLVALSTVFAFPMTFLLVSDWLEQFSKRVDQSPWIYVLAAALLCSITWLTVAALAIRAARVRPAWNLRHE